MSWSLRRIRMHILKDKIYFIGQNCKLQTVTVFLMFCQAIRIRVSKICIVTWKCIQSVTKLVYLWGYCKHGLSLWLFYSYNSYERMINCSGTFKKYTRDLNLVISKCTELNNKNNLTVIIRLPLEGIFDKNFLLFRQVWTLFLVLFP